ncbi:MAG: PTS sugar transporter subunit IIA [Myxococcales bacterium]|nr:PTS sugar transporter subunit IIA [Myxococcales bacterium]
MVSRTKRDVLAELAELLSHAHPDYEKTVDRKATVELLLERERLAATGVGNGIAIPHATSDQIDRLYGAFAYSPHGVEFGALDRAPCHFFFALMAPRSQRRLHIKALATISRLLSAQHSREAIVQAADATALYEALLAAERDLPPRVIPGRSL